MEKAVDMTVDFEDYFPSMMERYGAQGLLTELCNGFRLLMDGERGRITFESLKMKSVGLGWSPSSFIYAQ
ncbi:hypothetical protein V6N13_068924 [Hibiscus sabdariffa]|uniref:Uncharacterized protein n=1 Tax=Hibiscus sabdariffa TaxID=183260 RepID=A0ABR2QP23_9ROSI